MTIAAGPVPGVTSLGGHIAGGPSAMRLGSTRTVLVFCQGADGAMDDLVHRQALHGKWTSLGGKITSKPGAADVDGSGYSVYARGADGAVWARDHTAKGWGPWHTMGGQMLAGTGPSAAYRAGIHAGTFVLVVGTNRVLYMAHAGVPGFERVGGETTATPALVNTTVALVGFARGMDDAGYCHRFMPSSPGWHPMSTGLLASGVGASVSGNDTWTYTMGTDGQIHGDPGSWNGYPPAFGGWGPRTP